MTIRDLTAEDFSAVDMLMDELHALHAEKRPDIYVPAKQIYSKEQFEEMLQSEKNFAIGAEIDGKLAGICFFEVHQSGGNGKKGVAQNRIAFVNDIVVAEKFRRRGIAKELFAVAEKTAKEKGAVRIDLMVWNFNEDAIEFYKSMGMDVQRFVLEKQL